jgi:hypothetical protein
MAVIINEMEVVLETPKRPDVDAQRLPPPMVPTLRPVDMVTMMEREIRNEVRVLAH